MLLEIGWRQGEAVVALAQAALPTARVAVRPDFAGHDRLVVIETEPSQG
jgi:methylase of polypeptide subunit release factors